MACGTPIHDKVAATGVYFVKQPLAESEGLSVSLRRSPIPRAQQVQAWRSKQADGMPP
jgi:hypothetical protein